MEARAALRAFYADMGIDIDPVIAAAASQGGGLLRAVQSLDLERSPQAVLAARSEMGFKAAEMPELLDHDLLAKWIRQQVMAGEWDALAACLAKLPANDASGVYAHILQAINQPRANPREKYDPALLPEDVLALADAAPGELSDWQLSVLAQLLRTAATKYGTGPMLASIANGTRLFGSQDQERRERTVKFLVAAGLIVDAYAYFPSIEDARAKRDASGLLNHGRYYEDLVRTPGGEAEKDRLLQTAWTLYGEVALMPEADASMRREAIRRAIDLLPSMPPLMASAWLREIFANSSLAPAALEAIALKAVSLRNARIVVQQRAQTILTMKEAVDTLLDETAVDIDELRVPLRMLTTALITEAEASISQGQQNMGLQRSAAETDLLLRALPNRRWLDALEPSLASRAYDTAITIATSADEVDVALDYLAQAVQRFPSEGVKFADNFLRQWEARMSQPWMNFDQEMYFIGFVQNSMPAAPLTRGRQRRNLERLERMMSMLDEIGVQSRQLPSVAAVFRACHGRTEVFTREGVERVFGPIEEMSPATAAALAEQMRMGLSADWRDRRAQQAAGMKRSADEIMALVEQGYALAIELIDRALTADADSWRYAVTKAGLALDRVQYKQDQERQDFATYNQYRKEAFAAFEETAGRYADLVRKGTQRDDVGVYLAWFNAAVGGSELNYLTRDDLLVEGSPQDDQIDLIRKAILALPPDAADRHLGAFAQTIVDALPSLGADIKPRLVRHALRIIGDHSSGASLRRLSDLYQDLVKDEIKLRLAVDGDDRVDPNGAFGVALTLRFTTAVDRETGGFSRYLQNDVWMRVGNSYRPVNHRDQLQKSIEAAFNERFEVVSIGFFEALAPPRPVREGGEDGWLEKPLAYLVLKARDASTDRLPSVSMDLLFNDTMGPVTLPLLSNAPTIDGLGGAGLRPVRNLELTQTVDLRGMHDSESGRVVTLEVQAFGEGVLPELDQLLTGYRTALVGYEVTDADIETRPLEILQEDEFASMRYYRGVQDEGKGYIEPDETGMYRLKTQRSWVLTYRPTGGAVGDEFTLPTLVSNVDGSLVSRTYSDMDVVQVSGPFIAVQPPIVSYRRLAIAAVAFLALVVGVIWFARRRRPAEIPEDDLALPSRITPLSVVTTLRRVERESGAALEPSVRRRLSDEIRLIEAKFFGPNGNGHVNGHGGAYDNADSDATHELSVALDRWVREVRR